AVAISIVGGSLNIALIPTFVRIRAQEGHEAAQRLLSSMLVVSALALSLISLFLFCSGSQVLPLISSSFTPAKLHLTASLFWVLVPCLAVSGIATTWTAVLNACECFALPACVPIITPTITMV